MSRHIATLQNGSEYTGAINISIISRRNGKRIPKNKSATFKISGCKIVVVNTSYRNLYVKGCDE